MFGYNLAKHPFLNQTMICMWFEEERFRRTEVRIIPGYGSNICSYSVDGIEYLYQGFTDVAGMKFFGIPMMFPFPNRVSGCRVTFNDEVYILPDNDNGQTLHGLISATPFTFKTPVVTDESISVTTTLAIQQGHPLYQIMPIAGKLELTITLTLEGLRLGVKVTNQDGEKRLPFGFGIHPYFNVWGLKQNIRIRVPAQGYMVSQDMVPTGKVLSMDEAPVDLREATPLDTLDLDDVWLGMTPLKPMEIYYDAIGRKLSIFASKIFTHAVTYTPPIEGFFCLENQTNATDALRLTELGFVEEAHLLVLEPGESIQGSIQFSVTEIQE